MIKFSLFSVSLFVALNTLKKKKLVPLAGFDPTTFASSARRSPGLSYSGKIGISTTFFVFFNKRIIYI